MKVFIASDHAGFKLKQEIIKSLAGMDWQDLGCDSSDRVDYPDYAHKLCKEVLINKDSIGILICGSGQGMAISANKHSGIRAALCWSEEIVNLAREHNDANVLCLPARFIDLEQAKTFIASFIGSEFEGGRHAGRVEKIDG